MTSNFFGLQIYVWMIKLPWSLVSYNSIAQFDVSFMIRYLKISSSIDNVHVLILDIIWYVVTMNSIEFVHHQRDLFEKVISHCAIVIFFTPIFIHTVEHVYKFFYFVTISWKTIYLLFEIAHFLHVLTNSRWLLIGLSDQLTPMNI